MSDSEAVVEKIVRLRNERSNLVHEIGGLKKLADSEATALEGEVSMLREELRVMETKKTTDSEDTAFDSVLSMVDERVRIEEPEKLTDFKTTAFESALRMLDEVKALRMELSPKHEPREESSPKKKAWWRLFR